MRDLFIEIIENVSRNKLRTGLTGFSVAWGIFMLIVLLGAGNGLKNNTRMNMAGMASNVMEAGGGYTSMPYDGLEEGRRIRLEGRDVDITASELFSGVVDDVTATVRSSSMTISLGKRYLSSSITGVYPVMKDINKLEFYAGRFVNDKDIKETRKVLVIDSKSAENLLDGSRNYEKIIGKRVNVGGFTFLVVGVYKADESQMRGVLYAPYSTVRSVFKSGDDTINDITFTFHGLETEEENEAFEDNYRGIINKRHRAAPTDKSALYIYNSFTQQMQMDKGMNIITVSLWIVGLFTLLSGIVGVSNIMLISVKERTHEFGIRKAIGAKPFDIMKLIISESVMITAAFGYLGMFLGMLACWYMDATLGASTVKVMNFETRIFVDPTVGLDVALEATLVLIIAGTIAGLVPAVKATRVRPIEALRSE